MPRERMFILGPKSGMSNFFVNEKVLAMNHLDVTSRWLFEGFSDPATPDEINEWLSLAYQLLGFSDSLGLLPGWNDASTKSLPGGASRTYVYWKARTDLDLPIWDLSENFAVPSSSLQRMTRREIDEEKFLEEWTTLETVIGRTYPLEGFVLIHLAKMRRDAHVSWQAVQDSLDIAFSAQPEDVGRYFLGVMRNKIAATASAAGGVL